MDMNIPILKNRKWIVLALCLVVMVALGVTVLAMTQPDDDPPGAMASVPVPSILPTSGPTVPPTQPEEPTLPSVPQEPVGVGVTHLPGISLIPDPPTLELNTLKRKDFTKVNGYITCKTEEYWLGIDVSIWQEDIDWEK